MASNRELHTPCDHQTAFCLQITTTRMLQHNVHNSSIDIHMCSKASVIKCFKSYVMLPINNNYMIQVTTDKNKKTVSYASFRDEIDVLLFPSNITHLNC